jgi:hypothetical protein
MSDFKVPKLTSTRPTVFSKPDFQAWQEWKVSLPEDFPEDAHATYLSLKYAGDIGRIYAGSRLLTDNFNSNQPWKIALNRFQLNRSEKTLKLILTPSQNTGIFQDIPTPVSELNRAELLHYEATTDAVTELERE